MLSYFALLRLAFTGAQFGQCTADLFLNLALVLFRIEWWFVAVIAAIIRIAVAIYIDPLRFPYALAFFLSSPSAFFSGFFFFLDDDLAHHLRTFQFDPFGLDHLRFGGVSF